MNEAISGPLVTKSSPHIQCTSPVEPQPAHDGGNETTNELDEDEFDESELDGSSGASGTHGAYSYRIVSL